MSPLRPRIAVSLVTLDDPILIDTRRIQHELEELGLDVTIVGIDWATDDEWFDLHHPYKLHGKHAAWMRGPR